MESMTWRQFLQTLKNLQRNGFVPVLNTEEIRLRREGSRRCYCPIEAVCIAVEHRKRLPVLVVGGVYLSAAEIIGLRESMAYNIARATDEFDYGWEIYPIARYRNQLRQQILKALGLKQDREHLIKPKRKVA